MITASQIAGLVRETKDVSVFRREIRRALEPFVGCQRSLFHDEGPDATIADGERHSDMLTRLRHDWRRYGVEMRPFLSEIVRNGITTDVRALGDASFERSAFHQELMRPLCVRETLYLRLAAGDRVRSSILAFGRGPRDRPFEDSTITALRQLLPVLTPADAAAQAMSERDEPAHLSARERDLVELVSRGRTNKEIATHIGISVNTVRNRLARLFKRHAIASRAELVHRFGR